MKYIFYGVLLVAVFWIGIKMFSPVQGLKTLASDDFAKNYKGHMLIDVREPHEYKSGHLPQAINIPLGQLASKLSEIPSDQAIYLYCRSGMRSKQAGATFAKKGFKDISHLAGGILAWNGEIVK